MTLDADSCHGSLRAPLRAEAERQHMGALLLRNRIAKGDLAFLGVEGFPVRYTSFSNVNKAFSTALGTASRTESPVHSLPASFTKEWFANSQT